MRSIFCSTFAARLSAIFALLAFVCATLAVLSAEQEWNYDLRLVPVHHARDSTPLRAEARGGPFVSVTPNILISLISARDEWPLVVVDFISHAKPSGSNSAAEAEFELHVAGSYLGLKQMLDKLSTRFPALTLKQVRMKASSAGQVDAVLSLVHGRRDKEFR